MLYILKLTFDMHAADANDDLYKLLLILFHVKIKLI